MLLLCHIVEILIYSSLFSVWKRHPEFPYCYGFDKTALSFQDAASSCKQLGTQLADLEDYAGEHEWVGEWIKQDFGKCSSLKHFLYIMTLIAKFHFRQNILDL